MYEVKDRFLSGVGNAHLNESTTSIFKDTDVLSSIIHILEFF